MSNIKFTHLHTHTPEGSLLDGFMQIDKAIKKIKSLGMDSLAVSDHGTMAAHYKFNEEAKKANIHPVFGTEAYITTNKKYTKADFEKIEIERDEEDNYIFAFMKEEEFFGSWMPVENFPTKKIINDIERIAKKTYYPKLFLESLDGLDINTIKKSEQTRATKKMVEDYIKNGYKLCVKADTSQKDYFEWFPQIGHLLLLAKNNEGYQNMITLNNIANLEGFYRKPRIDYEDIKKYGSGIIATSACFLEGAPVLTENGIESIEDIQSKTNVLTHRGNWKPVEFRTTRDYTGDIFTFATRGSSLNLTATSDHKMLVFEEMQGAPSSEQKELRSVIRESLSSFILKSSAKNSARQMVPYGKAVWKEAHELAPGDLLLTAIEDKIDSRKYVDISSFAMDKMKKPLKNYILLITPQLLELLGIYAAEGSFGEDSVTFTVDSRKENLIEFIVNSTSDIFGQEATIYQKGNTKGVDIRFNSSELKNLFASWFGHGASNKRMPSFVRYLEPKLQIHFLKGLMYCDGHSRISGSLTAKIMPKTHNEVSISTTSKTLLYDLVHILHRNDLNPCVYNYAARVDKNGVSHKEWYSLNLYGNTAIRIHEFVFENKDLTLTIGDRLVRDIPLLLDGKRYMRQEIVRISSSHYEGPVYCLNVKEDHSFHAFGTAVHNCLGSVPNQLLLRGHREEAIKELKKYMEAFDELYIELQPSRNPEQIFVNEENIKIAKELGLKIIVTCDAHMVDKEEEQLHQTMTNIGQGSINYEEDESDISVYDTAYLMSQEEILSYGIPKEALQNAYDLSHRCQVTFLDDIKVKYPEYEVPAGETFGSYLNKMAWQGLLDLFLRKDYIEDYDLYQERLAYELDVIESKGLAAYFIIVSDYVQWAKDNGIYVGPGRGCTTKETQLYTEYGIKPINEINVEEKVYTHTGDLKEVLNKFEYDVNPNESLIKIRTYYDDYRGNTYTKDHKILAVKQNKHINSNNYLTSINQEPKWTQAGDLEVGDLVVFPKIKIKENNINKIDLSKYIPKDKLNQYEVTESTITHKDAFNKQNIDLRKKDNWHKEIKIKRYIDMNERPFYWIGLMTTNGWLNKENEGISICVNINSNHTKYPELINNIFGIKKVFNYKYKDLITYTFSSEIVRNLMFSLWEKCYTPQSINNLFLNSNKENRMALIKGLWESNILDEDKNKYISVSFKLIENIKYLLSSLNIPNGLTRRKDSSFWEINIPLDFEENDVQFYEKNEEYVLKRIYSLEEVQDDKVYDIEVEDNHSYLTTSFAAHNSGAGSLVCYVLSITNLDPIQHQLLFERFLNPERNSLPDLDLDFSSHRRHEVVEYLQNKYGKDKVASIGTYQTMTSKAILKNVGKVEGVDHQIINEWNKHIPSHNGTVMSIENAVVEIPTIKKAAEDYPRVFNLAIDLQEMPKSSGIHACFDEDTLITTKQGLKRIAEIEEGEEVLTHKANFQPVTKIMMSKSEDIYHVRTSANHPVRVTGNHPFYVREMAYHRLRKHKDGIESKVKTYGDPFWKQVSDLTPGKDYVGIPINKNSIVPSYANIDLPFGKEDFWWIIGCYIGDGWTEFYERTKDTKVYREERVIICCTKKVEDEKDFICNKLDSLGFLYRVEESRTTYKIFIKKEGLYPYLQYYGKYAHGKKIHSDVFDLPEALGKAFLEGYLFADGNYLEAEDKHSIRTVSKELAIGTMQLINKFFKRPASLQFSQPKTEFIEGRKVNSRKKYTISFTSTHCKKSRSFYEDGYIWTRISKVEKEETFLPMYNLTVLNDSSYVANGMAVHNCGFEISPVNLYNNLPLSLGKNGELVTQYEGPVLEKLGYIKFDILGVKVLSIIEIAVNLIEERTGIKLEMNELEPIDEKVFETIRNGNTQGIFQLSSPGMTNIFTSLKKVDFDSLIAGVSLYRPGPMQYIDEYVNRANGLTKPTYIVPELEDILKPTFGIAIYQESIMQITQVLGGYSAGQADSFRKAIGKKSKEVMDKELPKLYQSIISNGYSEEVAKAVNDIIEPFIGYGLTN